MLLRHFYSSIVSVIFVIATLSCSNKDNSAFTGEVFANYFQIKGDTIIVINSWEDNINSADTLIFSPVERVICMSTSHIAFLEALGAEDKIVGISGAQYISSQIILEKIKKGEIVDIGYEGSLNYEKVLELKPDLVITYGIKGADNSYIEKLKRFGVNVLSIGDYLESDPLGKLEYIRLFGKLCNLSEKADSLFKYKVERYLTLKENVSKAISENKSTRKNVLLNAPWKESWYIPGADNNHSILIHDAGGNVLGAKKGEVNSSIYSFEKVVVLSSQADFWLHPNSITTLTELENSNPLFPSIIKNIQKKNPNAFYNNNLRMSAGGGNDFFERGVVEPEMILEDLIKILHPEIISNDGLVYYRKLN